MSLKKGEVNLGTSIMAVAYKDGVILGADSRTTTGAYIANRVTDNVNENEAPSVRTASALFQEMCYQNKDHLSAGIIVAGWDKTDGPSVYNIPLGGSLHKAPFAIGGMWMF
ncbi:hypothetical protein [Parasitella parasitica]|uniref:Proteasome endopeptidase complex n=1 Tax=Parasitella parasitica TaxID=35722 RepID=A0A0B7NBL5_9FUNG|nr:hypothetical protein [Parasitella parasitica]